MHVLSYTMANNSELDIAKIKKDIRKYTKIRDNLTQTIKKMEEAKQSVDETLKNVPNEENMWKDRCLQQQQQNQKLQEDLESHQRELKKLKTQIDGGGVNNPPSSTTRLDSLSDLALKQLQKRLEKEKTEMEWNMAGGWIKHQQAKEEKKAIMTQIGHVCQTQHVACKDVRKTSGDGIARSHSTH